MKSSKTSEVTILTTEGGERVRGEGDLLAKESQNKPWCLIEVFDPGHAVV